MQMRKWQIMLRDATKLPSDAASYLCHYDAPDMQSALSHAVTIVAADMNATHPGTQWYVARIREVVREV